MKVKKNKKSKFRIKRRNKSSLKIFRQKYQKKYSKQKLYHRKKTVKKYRKYRRKNKQSGGAEGSGGSDGSGEVISPEIQSYLTLLKVSDAANIKLERKNDVETELLEQYNENYTYKVYIAFI